MLFDKLWQLFSRVPVRRDERKITLEMIDALAGLDDFELISLTPIAGGDAPPAPIMVRVARAKSFDTSDERIAAQIAGEMQAYEKAINEHRDATLEAHGKYEGYLAERQQLMRRHFDKVVAAIARDLEPSRGQPTLLRSRYGMLRPEYVAVTAFNYSLAAAEAGSRQQAAIIDICHAIDRQRAAHRLSEKYPRMFEDATNGRGWTRGVREFNLKWQLASIIEEDESFSRVDFERAKVGNQLLHHVIAATGLIEIVTRRRTNFLKLTAVARNEYNVLRARAEYFVMPQLQPLSVRPLDWAGLSDGGYYFHVHSAIKVRPVTEWKRKYRARFETSPPTKVLEALSHLQGTGYLINTEVQRRISLLLRGEHCQISTEASVGEDPNLPEIIDSTGEPDDSQLPSETPASKELIIQSLKLARLYQASGSPFYFAWQLDFRGRAYPIARSLGPQGSDCAHALLQFADGRPLSGDGEKWLALHGFNVLGVKLKEDTVERRLEWVRDNALDIRAVLKLDPASLEFWSGSKGDLRDFRKTAWRALAFCEAWHMKDVGDGAIGLPVAVDGTCNAIQHLAALTGDPQMAYETNMTGEPLRQDIYSKIAEELREKLRNDGTSADYQRFHQMMTEIGVDNPLVAIDRGLCKQPVMTKPYGVTPQGIRDALRDEFWARYGGKGSKLESFKERDKVYSYLGQLIRESVENYLEPATDLMGWLRRAAGRITKLGLPVTWETPLGLEVEQSYPVYEGDNLQTPLKRFNLGRKSSDLAFQIPTDDIDPIKSRNAIVANFVHSLDATHMLMTTLAAKRAGIQSLRMVHDSYATHPNDMELFAKLLRQEFIALYQRHDPIGAFKARCDVVLAQQGQPPLEAPPPRGKYDVANVADAPHFYS